jgi:hypothetical protein
MRNKQLDKNEQKEKTRNGYLRIDVCAWNCTRAGAVGRHLASGWLPYLICMGTTGFCCFAKFECFRNFDSLIEASRTRTGKWQRSSNWPHVRGRGSWKRQRRSIPSSTLDASATAADVQVQLLVQDSHFRATSLASEAAMWSYCHVFRCESCELSATLPAVHCNKRKLARHRGSRAGGTLSLPVCDVVLCGATMIIPAWIRLLFDVGE